MTSFNLPSLVDLTPVMAVFATLAGSMFSTSNVLQWLRNVLLDRLTAGMADVQRNDILRGVLFAVTHIFLLTRSGYRALLEEDGLWRNWRSRFWRWRHPHGLSMSRCASCVPIRVRNAKPSCASPRLA